MDTLPGLIIHDSKGFQSGATEEIELLRQFVKKRASAAKPEDRLDAIWYVLVHPFVGSIAIASASIALEQSPVMGGRSYSH